MDGSEIKPHIPCVAPGGARVIARTACAPNFTV